MNAKNQVVMSQLMLPQHANPAGNVHGGEIMKFMDNAAFAAAMKYARCNCVTARVDEIIFHLPIFVGALVTCVATVGYVGTTSMDVYVEVYSEDMESRNGPEKALCAHFTMVAMGKNGKAQKVPPYTPETEDEKTLYEETKAKVLARKSQTKK